jgi:hypothetical protein
MADVPAMDTASRLVLNMLANVDSPSSAQIREMVGKVMPLVSSLPGGDVLDAEALGRQVESLCN